MDKAEQIKNCEENEKICKHLISWYKALIRDYDKRLANFNHQIAKLKTERNEMMSDWASAPVKIPQLEQQLLRVQKEKARLSDRSVEILKMKVKAARLRQQIAAMEVEL